MQKMSPGAARRAAAAQHWNYELGVSAASMRFVVAKSNTARSKPPVACIRCSCAALYVIVILLSRRAASLCRLH